MRNIILICVSLILTCPCIAKTITVDDDGPADFDNIQAAINDASDGDTVLVKDGTYTGEGNRDIAFLGKAITVRSQHGPENCIIDCNGPPDPWRHGFNFYDVEGPNSILKGFTVTNINEGEIGGGVYCGEGSRPSIDNCILTGNSAEYGSAIFCDWSSPNITNCQITDNYSFKGVIRFYGGSPNITNCNITGNSGSIYSSHSDLTITSCDISNNFGPGFFSEYGSPIIVDCNINDNNRSGIYCFNGSLEISNCSLIGNTTSYRGGAICCERSSLVATNCNISDNSVLGGHSNNGGGIYCVETTAEIIDCNISGNWAEGDGGGVYGSDSNSVISSCLFSENTAGEDGGAIYGWGGLISNCTIIGNSASSYPYHGGSGGGIYCYGDGSPTITNCTIANNSAQENGGGISRGSGIISNCIITANSAEESGGGIDEWEGKIENCLITANSALIGGGIKKAMFINACTIVGNRALWDGGGLGGRPYRSSSVTNCIIWDNYAPGFPQLWPPENLFYNCIQDWTGGKPGNIDTDPYFVVPGYWVDVNGTPADPNDDMWTDGDYHLLANSPCIDAGDPNFIGEPNETDLDGNPRIANSRIDMGAYEAGLPAVEVELKLTPQMLSCDSEGRWVKAHVIMPEEIYPEEIDVNTPAVADPPGTESEFIEVNEYSDGYFDVQIYFDRESFCEALSESEDGLLEVTITGSLTDGRKFQGSDTIKLKSKLRQHRIQKLKRQFKK
jgi:predicted outer membrane repeat protein